MLIVINQTTLLDYLAATAIRCPSFITISLFHSLFCFANLYTFFLQSTYTNPLNYACLSYLCSRCWFTSYTLWAQNSQSQLHMLRCSIKKTPFIVCGFVQGPGWVLLKSAHSIKNMCHFYTHRNQAHAIFEYHRCIVHTIKIPYETIRRYMRYDMALIICMSLPGKIIIAFRVTYYGVRRLVYC